MDCRQRTHACAVYLRASLVPRPHPLRVRVGGVWDRDYLRARPHPPTIIRPVQRAIYTCIYIYYVEARRIMAKRSSRQRRFDSDEEDSRVCKLEKIEPNLLFHVQICIE